MKFVYPAVVACLCLSFPAEYLKAQTEVQTSHEVVGAVDTPGTITAPDEIDTWFPEAELDQMLAPIALYPDTILSHVLVAATYPLEIVEADRWRQNNSHLDAEAALDAVQSQNWDASVKALVAFPQLLSRLSQDLQWTRDLGDAVLMSEDLVMDRVQELRQQAWNHGELRSTEHVQVSRGQRSIIIKPTVERVVHLPSYDTRVVYGDWRWAHHPPVYWHPWHPVSYRSRTTVYRGQRHVIVGRHFGHSPPPAFYGNRTITRHHRHRSHDTQSRRRPHATNTRVITTRSHHRRSHSSSRSYSQPHAHHRTGRRAR